MKIKGDIDEIRYRNEDNGFAIVVLDVEGEPVVCKGVFPAVTEGQTIEAEGKFVEHPKFGRQFDASSAVAVAPESLDGMVRYLGSGLIKGIGPGLALRIVGAFGKNTFNVIENNPGLLARVKGISKTKAAQIVAAYSEIKVMRDAVMFLQGYGITPGTAVKIFNVYREQTVDAVSANPYILIEDVDGIGFITADKIAQSMGIAKDSEFRARAGVVYALKESVESRGNTYLPLSELIGEAAKILGVDEEVPAAVITKLVAERKLKVVSVLGEEAAFLIPVFKAEYGAADRIVMLSRCAPDTSVDVDGDVGLFEKVNGITLHPGQKDAVRKALSEGVVVITGGPGTGKTTIIRCILDILESAGEEVVCMAPTGRAAKRMTEATGREASTIHRALGITPGAERQNDSKIEADVVIVDEFSMVDVFLFNTLLLRLQPGTRLIMVGDKDQLPSVGAGNVLADLLKSDVVPHVSLTQVYRQDEKSLIVTNAHAINRGEMPTLDNSSKDFFFTRIADSGKIADTIVSLASERIPKFLGVTADKVQVLCPLKLGQAGVINLNRMLQNSLNPVRSESIEIGDYTFAVGDKVMHVVNDYDIEWRVTQGYFTTRGSGIFNGDVGVVSDVDRDRRALEVTFEDGRIAEYAGETLEELTLAYAITVHKSQGSEFDAVIMPIIPGSNMILTRNLLYTAITRARRAVVLVGDEYYLKRMVNNDYVAKRYSALAYFMDKARLKRETLFDSQSDAEKKFDYMISDED